MLSQPENITRLITEWQSGNREAENLLFEFLYRKLREIAGNCLITEPKCRTLSPTALVHEAYLRLANSKALRIQNTSHFVALAAQVMRRVVVDRARRRRSEKRGGDLLKVDALESIGMSDQDVAEILIVESALKSLENDDPRQARVVEMRFFAGLSNKQTADALGVAERTVKRDWQLARLKLREAIHEESHPT